MTQQLHPRPRIKGESFGKVLSWHVTCRMSHLKNIVKKDPLGIKMPKNEATVKSTTIVKLFDKIYHLASNFESDFKIDFTARQNAEF